MVLKIKQQNLFKQDYKGISFIDQLYIALGRLYSLEASNLRKILKEYNPIFFHYLLRQVDPDRIGPFDKEYDSPKKLWEPLQLTKSSEKTKDFLETVKEFSEEKHSPEGAILTIEMEFILTREHSGNKTTIGFFNIKTGQYKRYLIKDLKKVCKILRKSTKDFPRIFGQIKECIPYNVNITQQEKELKLSHLVEEDHSEITNEHIKEMIKFFKRNNVVKLVS